MSDGNELNESCQELILSGFNYVAGICSGGLLNFEPIVKGLRTYTIFQNQLFARKLVRFIKELDNLLDKERVELKKFVSQLQNDQQFQDKVLFALGSYIDKSDRLEKSELLAKILAAYLLEKIDLETMLRLQKAVLSIHMADEQKEWVIEALKLSNKDEQEFHNEKVKKLNAECQKWRDRINQIYLDKLDGKITEEFWQEKHLAWTKELRGIQKIIEAYDKANESYLEFGVQF